MRRGNELAGASPAPGLAGGIGGKEVLLYTAASTIGLWGLAHLLARKGVVAGFGQRTPDNRRIITMGWIVEWAALLATAAFVVAATAIGPTSLVSSAAYAVAVGTLIALATVSLFTGFRLAFLPFKLCPFIFGASAALIGWGAWLAD